MQINGRLHSVFRNRDYSPFFYLNLINGIMGAIHGSGIIIGYHDGIPPEELTKKEFVKM